MRGVYLTPGEHKVEFKYRPPRVWFWVTFASIALALSLIGYLAVAKERTTEDSSSKPIGRKQHNK